jgi:hypothetical protein
MRASWVLDDRGDVWSEASRNLGLSLHTNRGGSDLTNFLVAQMGFVVVREHPGWVEIKFDPDTASPVSLTSIFYWAGDRAFLPTSVVAPGETKVARVFQRKIDLDNYVGGLIERKTKRPDYERHQIDLSMTPFKSDWQIATELCRADLPTKAKIDVLQKILGDRFYWCERGENGDYEIVQRARFMLERDANFQSLQRPTFRAAYDRKFGAWSADQLKAIAGDDLPMAESLSVAIEFSDRPRQRLRYERMIVPTRTSTGGDALLIVSTAN